jgi:hypothetical protein
MTEELYTGPGGVFYDPVNDSIIILEKSGIYPAAYWIASDPEVMGYDLIQVVAPYSLVRLGDL